MVASSETVNDVRKHIAVWKRESFSIGLVPTMGFLHEGHLSLIERSVRENDRTVVSVFVNPTQFGENEDLESYPRDVAHDLALCEQAGVDLVFCPSPEDVYYPDRTTTVHMAQISEGLCGKSRPVHFDGVCLVLTKLFNIIEPNRAYFGKKDAQQLLIVRRLVRDLNFNLEIKGCPTVREADGLAKSSRNVYLDESERQAAVILSQALTYGRALAEAGQRDASIIRRCIEMALASEPQACPEYIEIVDTETIKPVTIIEKPVLCALAVRIGKTRLIDNFFFDPENPHDTTFAE